MISVNTSNDVTVRINAVYQALYDTPARYYIVYGGRRSSKSWSVSQLLVRQALTCPGRRIVIMRKYGTSIRGTVWERMLSAISEAIPLSMCNINKSERRITLPTKSEFIFYGADDVEKLKSIEGVGTYWLEEATEFIEQDFNVLDAGMSTICSPPPMIFFTFNPVPQISGYEHWLQSRFLGVDHGMSVPVMNKNACILRTWYQDNAMCPQDMIDLLEGYKDTNPVLYKMWALGEFSLVEGAILRAWDVWKGSDVPVDAQFLGYGMDFGYANDPCAVVKVWFREREIWVRQVVYASGLTNPDLSEVMVGMGVLKSDDIVADSSDPKSIEELKRMGWLVRPSNKSGGVNRNYKSSAALFMQGFTIHVFEDSPDIQRECATWSWVTDYKNVDKDGKPRLLPLVADGNDHAIDALIYRVYQSGGSIGVSDLAGARGGRKVKRSILSKLIGKISRDYAEVV